MHARATVGVGVGVGVRVGVGVGVGVGAGAGVVAVVGVRFVVNVTRQSPNPLEWKNTSGTKSNKPNERTRLNQVVHQTTPK